MLARMEQMPLFKPAALSVSELNRYLRQVLEGDELLQDLWVVGEISNLARPSSGHLYFTLKDASAAIPCVMWRSQVQHLQLTLRDGMAVEVHGSLSIYEAGGKVQIYTDTIRPAGEGRLYQEFLRLKALLEAEGLFDPLRKRPLPEFPHTIGIVTSPTGAALQDMLNTLRRRFPLAEVIIAPTAVQGEEAPTGIVRALGELNRLAQPDVILLARGGGSLEDLWAFNDERVVRAVVASDAPVITGVGHETDFTLSDFAADLRAPTPTAAAELATPNLADVQLALAEAGASLTQLEVSYFAACRRELDSLQNRLLYQSPLSQVRNNRQRLDEMAHRAATAALHALEVQRLRLHALNGRLVSLSPQSALGRGFAIVTRAADGAVVRSLRQVSPGDAIHVQVSDGSLAAKVTGNL
jgi:exodeoxyribonuclease VII large subunit